MQKIILRPLLAGILTLKTVLRSAPEHTIFIQNVEKKIFFNGLDETGVFWCNIENTECLLITVGIYR